MKKKDLFITLGVLFGALIFIVLVIILTGVFDLSTISSDNSSELGSITKQADDYDAFLDYNPEGDEAVESDTFIVIDNPELIYNNLTLMALGDLESSLSTWLISEGYSSEDFIHLTIIESTVVNDRTYPYFELNESEEIPRIKAYYNLKELEWVFGFK